MIVSNDGFQKLLTFKYTHSGGDKNGTPCPHPSIDYDRAKADPVPDPPSATLRLTPASVLGLVRGACPDVRGGCSYLRGAYLQVLGALHLLLLKLCHIMQRQFSLQASKDLVNLKV